MARFFLPLSALAAACAATALAAPAGAAPVPTGSVASGFAVRAELKSCSRGGQAGRYAVFLGKMPAAGNAARLQMRFDLFSRPDIGGPWKPVSGVPSFGEWGGSQRGAGGLLVTKQVFLNRGSAYRAVVGFRWLAADGQVVRSAVRTSKSCVQPDPRPDLGVAARVVSGDLVVVVNNLGRQAGPFELRVSSGGRQIVSQKVPGLGAGRARPLVFREIECEPESTLKVTVDPGGSIVERSEANNSAELRCPAYG